jgi:flagellar hook-length control protein FliK
LNKKSELSNEKEITEDTDNNSSHNQHGNIFLNTTTTLTNTVSKVKNKLLRSNQENILANSDNSVSNFTDENLEENISNLVSKFKKHTPEKDSKAIIANKDTNNLSEETDSFEADEVMIVKEDYLKIKKENLVTNKQINFADNKKEIISEANTEKFFETKYLHSSNLLSPQSKNNLNNQILLNNTALEVNATSQSTNSSNGNNGNQNGTQQNSSINNYQIYNDIKETLDMSDKRWASNLVSKINRSHASKTNEIELHLSPKNLGKLKIKISVTNKTAFVKVSTDSAATSSMILNEENKLSEMLKEVGLELEDFSSENSFNQSFSNGEQGKTKNKFKPADTNNSNDINDHENYIKDESLLNIKV